MLLTVPSSSVCAAPQANVASHKADNVDVSNMIPPAPALTAYRFLLEQEPKTATRDGKLSHQLGDGWNVRMSKKKQALVGCGVAVRSCAGGNPSYIRNFVSVATTSCHLAVLFESKGLCGKRLGMLRTTPPLLSYPVHLHNPMGPLPAAPATQRSSSLTSPSALHPEKAGHLRCLRHTRSNFYLESSYSVPY